MWQNLFKQRDITGLRVQDTADRACQDFGFTRGFFQDDTYGSPVLPSWLSGIRCTGTEAGLADCPRSDYAATSFCVALPRLFCISGSAFLVRRQHNPTPVNFAMLIDVVWMP